MSGPRGGHLEALSQLAQRTMAVGRLEEAADLWRQVLAASPEHPQALLHLGQHALYRKDPAQARELLARAAKAAPHDPAIPLNQAFLFRSLGDNEGEMAALNRALAIDPYFYPALLSKAMLLERMGQKRQAARIYKNVLAIAPQGEETPSGLKAPLEHARKAVEEDAAALATFLDGRVGEIRARHAGENLSRFDQCKDVATGAKKVFTQKPSLLHVPSLPAEQFYDEAKFPWLKDLEAETDAIREEFLAVYRADHKDIRPYITRGEGEPVNQWAELNNSPRWSTFFLWENGKKIEDHCAQCPRTAAVVESIPMADAPNYSPTVVFSLLAPHTRIPPHTGSTNARLIVHVPLIVPGKCFFRVGNETREWKVGRAWVFDDTIEHEAWNDSDELRVILMIDVWNPYLTVAERELVSVLLNGTKEYYAAG